MTRRGVILPSTLHTNTSLFQKISVKEQYSTVDVRIVVMALQDHILFHDTMNNIRTVRLQNNIKYFW
jgi:hypothetical protein